MLDNQQNTTNVAVDQPVLIEFNNKVDVNSVPGSVSLKKNNSNVVN
jgi:hypothetical protein